MRLRVAVLTVTWGVTVAAIFPLGMDAPAITVLGIAFSALFLLFGLRGARSNELASSGVLLAATYGRAVLFAEGTDEWAIPVAISLTAFFVAANAMADGRIDHSVGYWSARARSGAMWIAIGSCVASLTALAGGIEVDEARLVWLIGLAAVVVLLAIVAAAARSGALSSSGGP